MYKGRIVECTMAVSSEGNTDVEAGTGMEATITVFGHTLEAGDVLKRNVRGVGPIKSHKFTGEVIEKRNKTLIQSTYGEDGYMTDHVDYMTAEKMEERIKHGALLLNSDGETVIERFYGNPKKFR